MDYGEISLNTEDIADRIVGALVDYRLAVVCYWGTAGDDRKRFSKDMRRIRTHLKDIWREAVESYCGGLRARVEIRPDGLGVRWGMTTVYTTGWRNKISVDQPYRDTMQFRIVTYQVADVPEMLQPFGDRLRAFIEEVAVAVERRRPHDEGISCPGGNHISEVAQPLRQEG